MLCTHYKASHLTNTLPAGLQEAYATLPVQACARACSVVQHNKQWQLNTPRDAPVCNCSTRDQLSSCQQLATPAARATTWG